MPNSLKKFCTRLYQSLPVVRDLRGLEHTLGLTRLSIERIETATIFQALATLKAGDPRYRDPARLLVHGAQYWSQNYEDGMIAEIFRRIGVASKTFLEIGVGDGSENNTTALLSSGWHGWWLEADSTSCQRIQSRLAEMPSLRERLKLRQTYVTPQNIAGTLLEQGVPSEVDLFSLDIDLNTYHIWNALGSFKPRVVVVEYNAGIPASQFWVHPYDSRGIWDVTQDQGASLKAYESLGRKFGYSLVGCDITGLNAFFVRDDLLGDNFVAPFTSENHYECPRYFLTRRLGHPSKFYGESNPTTP